MNEEVKKFIDDILDKNNVVLFMKGEADFPQCGFSSTVVAILRKLNINFLDIDVLSNDQLREEIKIYTDWPTIPQLYLKGEFVGGCDIIKELYQSGELKKILDSKKIEYSEQ